MKAHRISIVVLCGALMFAAFAVQADERARTERDSRIPNQYIVVLKDSVADIEGAENELITTSGATRINSYRNTIRGFAARISEGDLATIKNDPRVEFVSEDRTVSIVAPREERSRWWPPTPPPASPPPSPAPTPTPTPSPTPTPTPTPAPTPSSFQPPPTGVSRIDAENKTNMGAGVQVAVIDTGIQLDHPDLKANILGGKNCTSSNVSAYGDQNGHGTHVAGTIAALNNTIGVVGVAPAAKLWSIRVLDASGNGSWSSVICGLDVVAANGPAKGGAIKVANLSLGGGGTSDNNCGNSNNDPLHKAICRARDAGVTVVVAAGNSGANAANYVPASYDDAVITVSALADTNGSAGGGGTSTSYGADDTFASFSNWGSPVDIGAPGVLINSTWLGGKYKVLSGTSMAAPHVAGAAALYLAVNPSASWSAVRSAFISQGEILGNGHTDPSGKHPENVLRAGAL